MKNWILQHLKVTLGLLMPLLGGAWMAAACSESDDSEEEFADWQVRNEAYFATLEDSLKGAPDQWKKLKHYALNDENETLGTAYDYIYVKVIKEGAETTESPKFTDSVRVVILGRLRPSLSYPEGYVFASTVSGSYDVATASTAKYNLSTLTEGIATALQHMHRGDYWRIYVPGKLGYGDKGDDDGTIPGHSVLTFDLTLIDFSPAGEVMPVWSSRKK